MTLSIAATCIGCGCSSDHACPAGCSWLRIDYRAGLGVCSSCPEHEARWDSGDRTLAHEDLDADLEEDEESSLILPGDPDFDDPFLMSPELDDYEVALELLR